VVVLTDQNFDDIVYSSKDIWLIELYAPWCGHCKALEPEWNQAASKLKGQVKFGKVDATEHKQLAQRFGVTGFPTIKYFNHGLPKSDSTAKPYEGPR
jgi:protein disulfide-isomerase A6